MSEMMNDKTPLTEETKVEGAKQTDSAKPVRKRRSKNSENLVITEEEIRDITAKAAMGAPMAQEAINEVEDPVQKIIEEVAKEASDAASKDSTAEAEEKKERKRRSNEEKRSKRKWGRRIACGAVVCALVGAVYGGGNLFFRSHFFPHTTINGVDCGMANMEKSFESIAAYLEGYQLNVISEEGEQKINADQVGLLYKDDADLQKLLDEQDVKKWFMHLGTDYDYHAMETTVDDKKLADTVNALDCITPTTPRASENPTLKYNEDNNNYDIIPGPVGNQVDVEALTQGVKTAMIQGDSKLDLSCNEFYVPSKYSETSEEVVKAKETADKYCSTIVHYQDNGTQSNITGKTYHKFIKFDKDFKVSLDEDAIRKFISTKLAKEFGSGEVTVINSPGSGRIYVSDGSGDKAVNVIAEKKKLIENIKAGKEVTRKPHYVKQFLYSVNGKIVDDDYVDINLSDQKVYVIVDGKKKVETSCVTGNVSAGRSSPTGIYRIAWKQTNYTMVKYNAFVHYWMPYDTSVGIGLHDATWRSSFGGNIYRYDGSHGCINLPLSKARDIYNTVWAGIPVIVHW